METETTSQDIHEFQHLFANLELSNDIHVEKCQGGFIHYAVLLHVLSLCRVCASGITIHIIVSLRT